MQKTIELVIFDLDGVIVTTDYYHYKSWKKIAELENIYFDEKINNLLRGVSRKESLEIILKNSTKKYTTKEKENLLEEKNKIYIKYLDELTEKSILPGVIDLIDYLKNNKYKIAIGSSSKNTKLILEKIGLINQFDFISDGTMVALSKPFPDIFLNASKNLSIEPSKCLVVEDAFSGIDAAINAHMKSVGIGFAANYEKCDYNIKNIYEIKSILERMK